MSARPRVRFFSKPSGERIAYAVHGSGRPLVFPAWWVSHVEEDWDNEAFRSFFEELGKRHQVIRYDRLGTGLSERQRTDIDLDEEVSTLAELVDHLELELFDVFAISCGGPPALRYAAQNPHRVRRLILFGSFVRGTDVGSEEVRRALQGLVRAHWGMGSQTLANLFAPDLPKPAVKRMSAHHTRSATAEMAARLLSLTFDVDVEEDATKISTQALVLHRRGDETVRHSAGLALAATLKNAELQTLEGNVHVPWLGDAALLAKIVLRFLADDEEREVAAPSAVENFFRRQGDIWSLSFGARVAAIKHARGVSDIATLILSVNESVNVGTLWSGAASAASVGGADPVLDDAALATYRRRYEELEGAIVDGEGCPDVLREERDALGRELRAAVGIGGRKRKLGDVSERARKAVSARIRASVKKIHEVHPALGEHLDQSISTGHHCTYSPREAIVWTVEEEV